MCQCQKKVRRSARPATRRSAMCLFFVILVRMDFKIMDASILILKPKQPLIDWVNEQLSQDDIPTKTLKTYDDDECGPTTYLIPDFEDLPKAKRWLKKHCRPLFEEVLSGWTADENDWPKDLSYKTFTQWFSPEFNLMAFDMRDSI